MADPGVARAKALGNIRRAQAKSTVDAISAMLMGQAAANAAALSGRAEVAAADREAKAAAAEEQAAAEGGAEQTDITQFFQPVQVNPNDPVGSLQALGISPGGAIDLSGGAAGASGGAIANRAVMGARQAAGTAQSAAPTQRPTVQIGGQEISAPETLTTTRETTAPVQFDPGFFAHMTTREVTTQPNAISMGDILAAKQRQEEATKDRALKYGNMILQHSLGSAQARGTIAATIMRSTNAPANISATAADALLSGNTEIFQKVMAGYDTTGKATIDAQRAYAGYYAAKAKETAGALGVAPIDLYDPLPFWGMAPNTKPPTGSSRLSEAENVREELQRMLMSGGLGGIPIPGGITAAERAAKIAELGRAGILAGSGVAGFVTPEGDPDEFALTYIPPQDFVALRWLAGGGDGKAAPEDVDGARKTLADMNLGSVNKKTGQWDALAVDPLFRTHADQAEKAFQRHNAAPPELSPAAMYLHRRPVLEGTYLPRAGGE